MSAEKDIICAVLFFLQPVPLGVTRQSKERDPASPVPQIAEPPLQLPASAPATITSTVRTRTLPTAPAPVRELLFPSASLSFWVRPEC